MPKPSDQLRVKSYLWHEQERRQPPPLFHIDHLSGQSSANNGENKKPGSDYIFQTTHVTNLEPTA